MLVRLFIAITALSSFVFAQTAVELNNYFATTPTAPTYLKKTYQNRNFEPIFARNGQWAISLGDLEAIRTAIKSHGLSAGDYQFQNITELVKQNGPTDLKTELFVAENLLKSIIHTVGGRIDPRKINDDVKYEPKAFTQWNLLTTVSAATFANLYNQVAPKNKFYSGLRKVLARLSDIEDRNLWVTVEKPTNTILFGQSHSSVAAIKAKLNLLGYGISNESPLYDSEFDAVLKNIQLDLSVPFEKGLSKDSKTWRLINSEIRSRVRETELNLEKVRWMSDVLESRHAIANIANQMFYVQDADINSNDYIMQFKAIGGQTSRRTPLMKDKVQSVILNPTWTATMNIFFKDKLPILKKNPGYLKQHGYKIINLKTDQEVDPASIDWANVSRNNIDFQIVQQPSYDNALGVVKFPMTNRYSIYLHDTGDRHLFKNNYRLLSSGCVRLEKPLDFAEYLLKGTTWTRAKIDATVAKPGQKIEKDTGIRLSKPLTIYIVSLTVAESGNKIQFFDDYYGLNSALYKKLLAQGLLK
tara:strand:+ start:22905 stop:24488 length:1584 start_codon:yes stop_codon:yes gene_type:complete